MNFRLPKTSDVAEHLRLWKRSWALIWASVPLWTVSWVVLIIIQGLLPVLVVYMTKLTIDSFVYARNHQADAESLNETIILFILTGIALLSVELFRHASDWIRTAQGEYFSDYIKNLTHRKSSEVDLEFYGTPGYHDLMEKAQGESQSKPLALLGNLGAIVQGSITLITFTTLLVSYGWQVPVLLVLGTLPGLYITLRSNKIYHAWWEKSAADRRWLMYFDGMLSNATPAAEMRILNLSETFRNRFQDKRQTLRNEKLGHLRKRLYGKLYSNILLLGVGGGAIAWVAVGVYNNTSTLGDLAVFYQIFSRGQTILGSLFTAIGQTLGDSLYLRNLFAFLDLSPRVTSPSTSKPFPREIQHGINFTNVTFRYPGQNKPALKDLDLFVPAGKKVALVGLNGAGKSTLLNLMCRFYDPEQGSITIDNVDIRDFDLTELRRNISVLFQFPTRFQETSGANIAYGDVETEPDDAKIETAARQTGAHQFISSLPDTYKTLLGRWFSNGTELSGGEWQKIALARAYFRRAQIMVLDEPTSFMDSWGEIEWFDRFAELAEDRTGLIITHRFTIAMRADIIHVVDQGRIIESGSHVDLVESRGFYAESWQAQMRVANEGQEQTGTVPDAPFQQIS